MAEGENMILVTGSTGLVGGHVLYHLLLKHERVAALRRTSASTGTLREIFSFYSGDPDGFLNRVDWRTGDMLDRESLVRALDGISIVVNCAAIVSFNPRHRRQLISSNVSGAENLATALLEKQNQQIFLIHVSSTSALGDGPGNDPDFLINEDTPRNLNSRHTGYSVSKFESERILRESGVNAVFLNPGIILGPGQWEKGSSLLFAQAWQGLRFYPYGGTGYVDVRDVADSISKIVDRSAIPDITESQSASEETVISQNDGSPNTFLIGERYCLVGANLRYRDFFNMVTDEFGKRNPDRYAGKFLTGLAWRAEAIRAALTGRDPVLTRETAEAARRISYYSGEKIRKALGLEFRPVEKTVEWVAGCWKKANNL